MPFEKMPVLSIDGHMLPQSFAIIRYLARQFGRLSRILWVNQEIAGYAGKNALEEATVDALGDLMKDYFSEAQPYFAAMREQKPAAEQVQSDENSFTSTSWFQEKLKKEAFQPAVERLFKFLEKYLKKSKSGESSDLWGNHFPIWIQDSSLTLD